MNIHTSKEEYLEAEIKRLHEANQAMLDALKLIANFPLEEFAQEKKPDTYLITRFNDWKFTVGDVRKARAAIAKGEQQ